MWSGERAQVLTLLDPAATRETLAYIIASSDLSLPFKGWPRPWLVPQAWDGNSAGLGPNATKVAVGGLARPLLTCGFAIVFTKKLGGRRGDRRAYLL